MKPAFAALLLVVTSPAQAAPVIAVFEIEDSRSGQERLGDRKRSDLTSYLASLLADKGVYQLVPSTQLQSALRDVKKASYEACYDERCQIEIGKAVAAEKTVAVRILKVGSKCAVTASLFDLRKEATESSATEKTACGEEEIVRALEAIAETLRTNVPAGGTEVALGRAPQINLPRTSVLSDLNPEAEKLLDAAEVAQDDPKATPATKAAAWCALARLDGKNAYKKDATEACARWDEYAKKWEADYRGVITLLGLKKRTDEEKLKAVDAYLAAYGDVADDRVLSIRRVRAAWPVSGELAVDLAEPSLTTQLVYALLDVPSPHVRMFLCKSKDGNRRATFRPDGRVATVQEYDRTATYHYDDLARVVRIVHTRRGEDSKRVEAFEYGKDGRIAARTKRYVPAKPPPPNLAFGHTRWEIDRDGAGRITRARRTQRDGFDPAGDEFRFTYDNAGVLQRSVLLSDGSRWRECSYEADRHRLKVRCQQDSRSGLSPSSEGSHYLLDGRMAHGFWCTNDG
jgi:hypothetical protein